MNIHKVADRILARYPDAEITAEMLTDFQSRMEKAYPNGKWSISYFTPLKSGTKISSLEIEAERAWTRMKGKVELWEQIRSNQDPIVQEKGEMWIRCLMEMASDLINCKNFEMTSFFQG